MFMFVSHGLLGLPSIGICAYLNKDFVNIQGIKNAAAFPFVKCFITSSQIIVKVFDLQF